MFGLDNNPAHFLNVSPKQTHDKSSESRARKTLSSRKNKGRKQREEIWWLEEPVVCDGSMQEEGGLKRV